MTEQATCPECGSVLPPDSPEAGNLLARYIGTVGMQEADYSRAMEAFGQGLAVARRTQDTTPEMTTTAQAAQVDRFHLYPRRGLEESLSVIELANLVHAPHSEILVRGVATGSSLVIGDLEGARGHAAAMLFVAGGEAGATRGIGQGFLGERRVVPFRGRLANGVRAQRPRP